MSFDGIVLLFGRFCCGEVGLREVIIDFNVCSVVFIVS